jgi:hypothetical protein
MTVNALARNPVPGSAQLPGILAPQLRQLETDARAPSAAPAHDLAAVANDKGTESRPRVDSAALAFLAAAVAAQFEEVDAKKSGGGSKGGSSGGSSAGGSKGGSKSPKLPKVKLPKVGMPDAVTEPPQVTQATQAAADIPITDAAQTTQAAQQTTQAVGKTTQVAQTAAKGTESARTAAKTASKTTRVTTGQRSGLNVGSVVAGAAVGGVMGAGVGVVIGYFHGRKQQPSTKQPMLVGGVLGGFGGAIIGSGAAYGIGKSTSAAVLSFGEQVLEQLPAAAQQASEALSSAASTMVAVVQDHPVATAASLALVAAGAVYANRQPSDSASANAYKPVLEQV